MQILIVEITSLISFLFSILLILFNKISIKEAYIIFIYVEIIMIAYSLLLKKSKLWKFLLAFLPFPLIPYNNNNHIYLILVSSVVLIYYAINFLGKGDSFSFTKKLKLSYILYLLLVFMGIISIRFRVLIYKSIPFMIIYLVSMILLIRNLRNNEHGLLSKKSNKQTYTYLIVIFIVSLFGSLPGIRNFILKIGSNVYVFLANTVLKVGYFIVTMFAGVFFGFFGLFIDSEKAKKNTDILLENIAENSGVGSENEYVPTPRNISPILNIIIAVIVFTFIVFIIIKAIKVKGERNIKGLDFTEKREFIKSEKNKSSTRKNLFKPRDNREKVRHYYKKYLKLLTKESVEIDNYDTSLNIFKKASRLPLNNNDIRKIYIKSRYSSSEIKEKDIDKIKKHLE